jgi:hypothetical protein
LLLHIHVVASVFLVVASVFLVAPEILRNAGLYFYPYFYFEYAVNAGTLTFVAAVTQQNFHKRGVISVYVIATKKIKRILKPFPFRFDSREEIRFWNQFFPCDDQCFFI